uniref:Uncharacterized protein n=1 Tax=Nelumbo nucifera TaxID=4432 RepID=A0A822YMW3_NELNU|nr:TPA_asm: hypothetical protein HUJ06_012713 [Nelumbo nucifera]
METDSMLGPNLHNMDKVCSLLVREMFTKKIWRTQESHLFQNCWCAVEGIPPPFLLFSKELDEDPKSLTISNHIIPQIWPKLSEQYC